MQQHYIDKKNLLQKYLSDTTIPLKLELGPGNTRHVHDGLTIDIYDAEGVDIISNIEEGLTFIPDNSIDYIYSSHVMEHIKNFELLLKEIYRILKPNGKYEFVVPHFSNPYFYSDYTHKTFFGLYTMCYFSKTNYFIRKTPQFYNTVNFKIDKVKLEFTSPFWWSYPFKKFYQLIFNSLKIMQEIYEEKFFNIFPAYQVRYIVSKP